MANNAIFKALTYYKSHIILFSSNISIFSMVCLSILVSTSCIIDFAGKNSYLFLISHDVTILNIKDPSKINMQRARRSQKHDNTAGCNNPGHLVVRKAKC